MPSACYAIRLAAAFLLAWPACHMAFAQVGSLPVLDPISDVSVSPDQILDVPVHASDADGEPITFLTNFAPPFVSTFSTGPNDGTVRLAPAITDIGSAVITVAAQDPFEDTDWSTFTATITPPPEFPVAYAGGPYNGHTVEFDGTRSFDPQGSALTYLWDFGDGVTASGPMPVHDYCYSPYGCLSGPAAGSYVVTLTVTDDQGHSARGTTYVIVTDLSTGGVAFPTRKGPIKIPAGNSSVCFRIQAHPRFASFDPRYVDLSGVQLRGPYDLGAIDAVDTKTALVGDTNGDGLMEIQACFRSEDLARILTPAPSGRSAVRLVIGGPLLLVGQFTAVADCVILKNGSSLVAQVLPNPVRSGRGNLEFATEAPGPVRAELFDVHGRRVRVLLDESFLPAGYHAVGVEGQESLPRLPRGIYFYRVAAGGAETTGKLVLAR